MLKTIFKTTWLLAFALMAIFTACDKQESTETDVTAEEYTDQALFIIQEEGNIGPLGCYDLVFPISVEMPDGETITVEDYDELIANFRAWREANPGRPDWTNRPHFVFPVDVIDEEGTVLTVENHMDMRQIREACGSMEFDRHGPRGHHGRCRPCFKLVFPITILFPDDTTVEVADRQELKQTIRQWKQDHPGVDERPEIVFPITVEIIETGETVTVNSREELKELRRSCQD